MYDAIFVFASDMPCISSEIVKKHIEFYNKRKCDAAIPRIKDFKEPLHAIYNKKILDNLSTFLSGADKYYIENFIKDLNVRYHNLEDLEEYRKAFTNINTPEDLTCMELYSETHFY
jgi:molybdopterin-guanine dinucleotide biosynthesis protein A